MKLVPERDVIKVKKDDKRNTRRRYLTTDAICFKCAAIVNYVYEKRCILCCGSEEFLVGESSIVLRELLELDIEQVRVACELRGISGSGYGPRIKLTLELFKLIFPRLTGIDKRINESLIRNIIYRNKKRFRYIANIEDAIIKVRHWKHCNIRLVDEKDMRKED